MSRKQDREDIVREITNAAILYKKHLIGKRFLYIFDDRYIEVIYKAGNFRHLTGVGTSISSLNFYEKAVKSKLQAGQIYFGPRHPYELCRKKIKHICDVATLASSESFILEEISTESREYRFGTTDLNFTLCMDMEYDAEGNEKGDCLVVYSLRDGDCFDKSRDVYSVSHILSRANNVKGKYAEILFCDASRSLNDLPENIKAIIDEGLLKGSGTGEGNQEV